MYFVSLGSEMSCNTRCEEEKGLLRKKIRELEETLLKKDAQLNDMAEAMDLEDQENQGPQLPRDVLGDMGQVNRWVNFITLQ
jgi:prefoldin subunit 5